MWKYIVSGLVSLLFAVSCYSIAWIDYRKELSSLHGWLIPDNKPTPIALTCKIPVNGIAVFFGNNAAAYVTEFPHTVIQLENKQLLIINKHDKRIIISGKFYSRDGKLVVEILPDNAYWVNPNDYFRIDRPDRHKLVVFDREGNQILNIEFINPQVIKIMGEYYLPYQKISSVELPHLVINEDFVQIGNFKHRGCYLGGQIDFHFKSDGSVDIESGPGPAAIHIGS